MRRGVLVLSGVAVCLLLLGAVAFASFGARERSVLRYGPATTVEKVVAYPGSRTLLLGHFHGEAGLLRVTAKGSRDATFGDHGMVRLRYGSLDGEVTPKDVAVGPGGTIVVVAGLRASVDGGDFTSAIVVERFLPGGRPDASFGDGGRLVFGQGGGHLFGPERGGPEVGAVTVARDGKIYIGAAFWKSVGGPSSEEGEEPIIGLGPSFPEEGEEAIVRLRPTGKLDTGFGKGGVAYAPTLAPPYAIALGRHGSVLLAGGRFGVLTVVRFGPRGRRDRSFAGGAVLVASPRNGLPGVPNHVSFNAVEGIGVTASGRIVLAGATRSLNRAKQPRAVIVAVRYLPNGEFDRSFGGGDGVAKIRNPAGTWPRALAVEPGGRVVVAAEVEPRERRFRTDLGWFCFDASGRPDRLCGRGGRALTDFGERDLVGGVALQPRGRAVLVGTAGPSGHERSQGGTRVALQRFRLGPGAVR